MEHRNENQVAEIELTYRYGSNPTLLPVVTKSVEAYQLFRSSWNENAIELVEEAKLMLLNNKKRVLGICSLSRGGSSATIVEPRMVFAAAIKGNASAIILAHNHPSGGLEPSRCDIEITKKLNLAADIIGIRFLDHLIVTSSSFQSVMEHEMMLKGGY